MSKKVDELWIEKYPHPPLPDQIKEFEKFTMLNDVVIKNHPFKDPNPKTIGLFNVHSNANENIQFCNRMWDEIPMSGCILVYWIPLEKIIRFNANDVEWQCIGSIITSRDIGYVFRNSYEQKSKGHSFRFGCQKFFSQHGSLNSSVVNKFLVERFMMSVPEYVGQRGIVFDTQTDQNAHLPLWCKRLGVGYIGHAGEKDLREIHNKLAQEQLPMVQGSLF